MEFIYSISVNIANSGSLHNHIEGIIKSSMIEGDSILVFAPGANKKSKFYKELNFLKTGPNLGNWYLNLLIFDFWMAFLLVFGGYNRKYSTFYYRPHIFTLFQPIFARLKGYKTIKEINGVFEYELKVQKKPVLSKIASYLDYITSSCSTTNIVVTPGIKKYFIERGIKEEKIRIVPNGIMEIPVFNYEIRTDVKVLKLTFIGKLSKWQGMLDFIKLISPLSSKYEFIIEIFGDGEELNEIQEFITVNKIEFVVIYGWLLKNELASKINETDIFLLPRKWPHDLALGSPLKLFEYMSIGRPIIATKVDGIINLNFASEYIDFFDYEDVKSLETILLKYQNYSNIVSTGKKLHDICKQYYTWQDTYKNIFHHENSSSNNKK